MSTLPALIELLESRVGKGGVLSDANDLRLYEYDGSVDRHTPDVVVFPRNRGSWFSWSNQLGNTASRLWVAGREQD